MTYQLLPSNATTLEKRVADLIDGRIKIQPDIALYEYGGGKGIPVEINKIWNIQLCPEELLPWLAWSTSIDFWDNDWNTDKKRDEIQKSLLKNRHRGTVYSVIEAIKDNEFNVFYNNDTEENNEDYATVGLSEWWSQNPPGEPYGFKLSMLVSDLQENRQLLSITPADFQALVNNVNFSKPVRSHFCLFLIVDTDFRFSCDPPNTISLGNHLDLTVTWRCDAHISDSRFSPS
jgi:phage tail P2-like protein